LCVLFSQDIHDPAKFVRTHARYGQIVSWRKTDNPTNAGLAARNDQSAIIETSPGSIGKQCRVIVVENQSTVKLRIPRSGSTRISRTHVARGLTALRDLRAYLLRLDHPPASSQISR